MSAEPVTYHDGLHEDDVTRLLRALNHERPLSITDLPDDDRRFELIDGELFVSPAPKSQHQDIAGEMIGKLYQTLPANLRVWPGGNVIEGERTILIPDVMVVDPAGVLDLGVVPDGLRLVVEISSPSTRVYDLTKKRALYEKWGVPFIFVDRKNNPVEIKVFGDPAALPDWALVLL